MYSPNTSPKKPSPLTYGSPRSSPFKRPTSTAGSQSSAPGTPQNNRSGASGPAAPRTPTRASNAIAEEDDVADIFTAPSYPTHSPSMRPSSRGTAAPSSPRNKPAPAAATPNGVTTMKNTTPSAAPSGSDAAAKVPPALLREMHESFQALDQDGDGQVNSADVAEALGQLGQNPLPATLTTFFPPGSAASVGLPDYINSLSSPLAAMSSPAELAAAFSAFDADDSGQIDVAELREALLQSHDGAPALAPQDVDAVIGEFAGKRAFSRGQTGRRGDVFKWREFVSATGGGPERKDEGVHAA